VNIKKGRLVSALRPGRERISHRLSRPGLAMSATSSRHTFTSIRFRYSPAPCPQAGSRSRGGTRNSILLRWSLPEPTLICRAETETFAGPGDSQPQRRLPSTILQLYGGLRDR
jgi:hypothetical protein